LLNDAHDLDDAHLVTRLSAVLFSKEWVRLRPDLRMQIQWFWPVKLKSDTSLTAYTKQIQKLRPIHAERNACPFIRCSWQIPQDNEANIKARKCTTL